ncbi:rhomboid family intramembrane serine protease [Petroclostridium sp. X23]|uniref:rhomboid family intramembrane serine protease n=1 Tax=Petroclostridium sp. X23 TaxID=3045146 RepID=UPI0024ACBE99|nr:rhomboid family intramembrane serine protease [Petroclostridium sp. X23]WHH61472.1 rhomboid family intramembrane serine protease [Petroclostridium sp. X23]
MTIVNWLEKLERRFGHLAIKGLMTYIVGLNGFIYFLMYVDHTGGFTTKLMLIPSLVFRGEVWRLITYVFIPPSVSSPIWIIFVLYLYYMIGNALEHEWGSFRFNMYYLLGMAGTTAAVFITGGVGTSTYLNLSLFLAFARIYPNYEFLLFFILPVKVKYLAWLNWIFIGFTVLFMPIPQKVMAIVSIINYFIFFGREISTGAKMTRQVHSNRRRFHEQIPRNTTIHKCTICGITEKDDPKMDFRYCVDCEGDHEYCMEHLKNHEHIKE